MKRQRVAVITNLPDYFRPDLRRSAIHYKYLYSVTPFERPPHLERPLGNVLISTPDERPPLLKGHFSGAKGMASQEGFHYHLFFITFVLLYFHGNAQLYDCV